MPDDETIKNKWAILMAEQDTYLATHRQIALKVLNLLLESVSCEELREELQKLREMERERNLAQVDIETARREGNSSTAIERVLDRSISAMERMNEGASRFVEQLDQLIATRSP